MDMNPMKPGAPGSADGDDLAMYQEGDEEGSYDVDMDLEAELASMSPADRDAKWAQIEELQAKLRTMDRSIDLGAAFGGMGGTPRED